MVAQRLVNQNRLIQSLIIHVSSYSLLSCVLPIEASDQPKNLTIRIAEEGRCQER